MNSLYSRDLIDEIDDLKNQVFRLQRRLRDQAEVLMPPQGRLEVLDFAVEGLHLCLPLEQVNIVVPRPLLSPLPEASPWIAGMLNLHGQSIPVIDILYRFAGKEADLKTSDLIIVATIRDHQIGLLVQEVFHLLVIEEDQLSQVEENLSYANYVAGIAVFESMSTYLLSLEKLLLLADSFEEENPE